MIDWQWIPGTILAAGALTHSLYVHGRRHIELDEAKADVRKLITEAEDGFLGKLGRQVEAQRQHGLMLWPRPWLGGRAMTQVEEVVSDMHGWLGQPLSPDEQHEQMMIDSQALLDSYKPPEADDG